MSWPSAALGLLGIVAAPLLALRDSAAQAPSCPQLDTTAAWAQVNRTWATESPRGWSNDSLRRVLIALGERDQMARADFGARATDTVYVRELLRLDSALAAEMTAILDRFGLPTKSLVGAAGSTAAMLIVQHNWPLQERVLALARGLRPGEVSPEAFGMLEDRVLVHQGKPQRLGTQFSLAPDGRYRFDPLADTTALDARRAAAGMMPLAQYVCFMEEMGMRIDRTSLPPGLRP